MQTIVKWREEQLRAWVTPALEFKGTVAEIVQSGGGQLSLALADSGEMRCEKPHVNQCSPF
jgi:hypothetical protein